MNHLPWLLLLLLLLPLCSLICILTLNVFSNSNSNSNSNLKSITMKVHPVPRKRNIALLRNDVVSSPQANASACRQKKLRRLPHIFAKVLELPFHSDADVSVQETSDSLRFVIATDDVVGYNIRAHTIEIYPGVTKIVIRWDDDDVDLDSSMELDLWRFRLPASTLPELASAAFSDGELVVTVPKGLDEDDDGDIGGAGRLVLVQ